MMPGAASTAVMHIYRPQGTRIDSLPIYNVRAERNYMYEGTQWVSYNRRYRRDPRSYNEAFTWRAKAIRQCSFSLQDDHDVNTCARNPHRPLIGRLP